MERLSICSPPRKPIRTLNKKQSHKGNSNHFYQRPMEKLNIFVVNDDPSGQNALTTFLTENEDIAFHASLPSASIAMIKQDEPDVVIVDAMQPEMKGLKIVQEIHQSFPNLEIILLAKHGDMHTVIQAMRLGASDYVITPFTLPEMQTAIERTRKFILLHKQLQKIELNYSILSQELYDRIGYHIIGNSTEIQHVLELMSKVAQSDETPVLILGESGTGKELIARGIHRLSRRKDQMFCSVNMAAITDTLFESEFFGYAKGAFTGAAANKMGWFEVAHHGTLFLDEICSMPLTQQAKLLRVLEERKIVKVGTHQEIETNARVIAATNRDIEQLVAEKNFREDLYYRLNAFLIEIPPLRQRKQEIPLLLENFMAYFSQKLNKVVRKVDAAVFDALSAYDFPGNIRELKNMVERAIILCDRDTLSLQHFPIVNIAGHARKTPDSPAKIDLEKVMKDTERRLIIEALEDAHQNRTIAAEYLGISRQSLHRRLKKFGFEIGRLI